jgi:hypothetical protein
LHLTGRDSAKVREADRANRARSANPAPPQTGAQRPPQAPIELASATARTAPGSPSLRVL